MVGLNAHNLIVVGFMAAVFFLLLKLANRTALAKVPVLGSALQLVEQAG